jgi:hypothetical protein
MLRFASSKKPDKPYYTYSKNVYHMDNFMAANASEREQDALMQARYIKARNRLGEKMDATSNYAIMTMLWTPEAALELTPWKY